jgi:ribose-phosphate pyrophosphokinase
MQYKRNKYPDGTIYAEITDFREPLITERINTYEDLFFIKSLKDICDYNSIKDVVLRIPCMFQQQHDRRFQSNQSFELKLVCDFINSCNFSRVEVFHPHSDSTQMGLNNCFILDNSVFIGSVLAEMEDHTPILLSTDAGSFKWINKLADKLEYTGEVYCANKSRDAETHKLTQVVDRQDFGGANILVLDDLCVYGGTFIGLAKMLKERNAGKLYLAVSHITVQSPNAELENYYDAIYCTNSKFDTYSLNKIQVIKYF